MYNLSQTWATLITQFSWKLISLDTFQNQNLRKNWCNLGIFPDPLQKFMRNQIFLQVSQSIEGERLSNIAKVISFPLLLKTQLKQKNELGPWVFHLYDYFLSLSLYTICTLDLSKFYILLGDENLCANFNRQITRSIHRHKSYSGSRDAEIFREELSG